MSLNIIPSFPTLRTRNAFIDVLQRLGGLSPVAKHDTSAASRALYNEFTGRMIVNTPSEAMQELLGKHRITFAIEVDDPTLAGNTAIDILGGYGFGATLYVRAEPELPEGFMCFVSVPAFDGIMLLFWPNKPDMEAVKAFRATGASGPWTAADLQSDIHQ